MKLIPNVFKTEFYDSKHMNREESIISNKFFVPVQEQIETWNESKIVTYITYLNRTY